MVVIGGAAFGGVRFGTLHSNRPGAGRGRDLRIGHVGKIASVRRLAQVFAAPEYQCETCPDTTRIERGCSRPLRDLPGRGIDQDWHADRDGCERERIPAWFEQSLHRLDIEAHGFCELVRPYVVMRVDGAVRDAMAIESSKMREAAQAEAIADAKARAHGAKDAASLKRTTEAAQAWQAALADQGIA